MYKSFMLLLIAFCLTGFTTSEESLLGKGYRELKGEELRKVIADNTEESSTGSFYYHTSNGKFVGVSGRSGRRNSGTWKINDEGRICRDWDNNRYIENGCSKIFIDDKSQDIQWYDADGLWYGTKMHSGNIKNY